MMGFLKSSSVHPHAVKVEGGMNGAEIATDETW
jgi:hypothetical protein